MEAVLHWHTAHSDTPALKVSFSTVMESVMRHLLFTLNELKMRDHVSSVTAQIVSESLDTILTFGHPSRYSAVRAVFQAGFPMWNAALAFELRLRTAGRISMDLDERSANGGTLTTSLAIKTGIPVSHPEMISNTSYVPFNATQPDDVMTERIDFWHKAAPSPSPRALRRSSNDGKPLSGATDNCRIF